MASNSFRKRKILLARHGQTEWNEIRRFQGRTDIPLNEEGRIQARKLAERLASWPVDVVYTSPLERALRTAEAVAARHGKTPVVLDGFTEMNFGSWEGESILTLKRQNPQPLKEWFADPFFRLPEGAETWEELRLRVEGALQTILSSPEEHAVIVSHGGIIRALFVVLLKMDPHSVWNISASNCAISGIEIREFQNQLIFSNDDLHLRDVPEGVALPVW
ncbi:MAG: histidine phosphatase family protein [Synergistaceae bacterium]|nr:histidine phosphatase family protein [Synergistaceae bacterium]